MNRIMEGHEESKKAKSMRKKSSIKTTKKTYLFSKLLSEFARDRRKVLFYPSAGETQSKSLFDMDYDVFILADKRPLELGGGRSYRDDRRRLYSIFKKSDPRIRLWKATEDGRTCRVNDKWVLFFFEDNNKVFERINKAGLSISCFVGVNDGCQEGGNYECVNRIKWLDRVFGSFSNGRGLYISDHPFGDTLGRGRASAYKEYLKEDGITLDDRYQFKEVVVIHPFKGFFGPVIAHDISLKG